jgi:hypothetical protein
MSDAFAPQDLDTPVPAEIDEGPLGLFVRLHTLRTTPSGLQTPEDIEILACDIGLFIETLEAARRAINQRLLPARTGEARIH